MLACHFHSTAWLHLYSNSLMGTIPSEVGLLSNLSESSIVWLLVVMIVLSCDFHDTLMHAFVIFHSAASLVLLGNSLTGMIPSEAGLLSNLSESNVVWLLVVLSFFILQMCCLSPAIV